MKTKKLLAVLLALVLCVGSLAACNADPAETTAPAAQGTTAPAAQDTTTHAPEDTTEAAPLTNVERYPIDFDGTLTCATGKTKANEYTMWAKWQEITGVDVEWQVTSEEQAALLFLAEKDMPDMFFQMNGLTTEQINEYGKAGFLINFMDYLGKMPNLAERYEENPNLFILAKDANNAVYTLPYYCNNYTMAGNLFYIRTDMTKEAGWDTLPSTVEEFLLLCEDLQNCYADVEGYYPMTSNDGNSMAYSEQYASFLFPSFGDLMVPGIGTNDEGTKIEIGFATEQFKRYWKFMNTLYTEEYMDPDCFSNESAVTKSKFAAALVTVHPTGGTSLKVENFASGELDFQIMPPMASSEYGTEARWTKPGNILEGYYMVSTKCSNIDAALAFLDALYAVRENPLNEEGTIWGASFSMGELGVNFTLDEEKGSYQNIPVTDGSVGGSGSAAYIEWLYVNDANTGSSRKSMGTRDYLMPYGVDIVRREYLKLTQEEQDTYNDCWTDINNYVTEMNGAFITGQKDIDTEWDNYIKTLYDMGLQDVIDVYQAALDRYNAG